MAIFFNNNNPFLQLQNQRKMQTQPEKVIEDEVKKGTQKSTEEVKQKTTTIVGTGSWNAQQIKNAGLEIPSEFFIGVYTNYYRFNPETISREFPNANIQTLADLKAAMDAKNAGKGSKTGQTPKELTHVPGETKSDNVKPGKVGSSSFTTQQIKGAGLKDAGQYFISVFANYCRFNPEAIKRDFPNTDIITLADLKAAMDAKEAEKAEEAKEADCRELTYIYDFEDEGTDSVTNEAKLKDEIEAFLYELDAIDTSGDNYARYLNVEQKSKLSNYLKMLKDKDNYPNLTLEVEFKDDNLCDIYLKSGGEYVYSVDDIDATIPVLQEIAAQQAEEASKELALDEMALPEMDTEGALVNKRNAFVQSDSYNTLINMLTSFDNNISRDKYVELKQALNDLASASDLDAECKERIEYYQRIVDLAIELTDAGYNFSDYKKSVCFDGFNQADETLFGSVTAYLYKDEIDANSCIYYQSETDCILPESAYYLSTNNLSQYSLIIARYELLNKNNGLTPEQRAMLQELVDSYPLEKFNSKNLPDEQKLELAPDFKQRYDAIIGRTATVISDNEENNKAVEKYLAHEFWVIEDEPDLEATAKDLYNFSLQYADCTNKSKWETINTMLLAKDVMVAIRENMDGATFSKVFDNNVFQFVYAAMLKTDNPEFFAKNFMSYINDSSIDWSEFKNKSFVETAGIILNGMGIENYQIKFPNNTEKIIFNIDGKECQVTNSDSIENYKELYSLVNNDLIPAVNINQKIVDSVNSDIEKQEKDNITYSRYKEQCPTKKVETFEEFLIYKYGDGSLYKNREEYEKTIKENHGIDIKEYNDWKNGRSNKYNGGHFGTGEIYIQSGLTYFDWLDNRQNHLTELYTKKHHEAYNTQYCTQIINELKSRIGDSLTDAQIREIFTSDKFETFLIDLVDQCFGDKTYSVTDYMNDNIGSVLDLLPEELHDAYEGKITFAEFSETIKNNTSIQNKIKTLYPNGDVSAIIEENLNKLEVYAYLFGDDNNKINQDCLLEIFLAQLNNEEISNSIVELDKKMAPIVSLAETQIIEFLEKIDSGATPVGYHELSEFIKANNPDMSSEDIGYAVIIAMDMFAELLAEETGKSVDEINDLLYESRSQEEFLELINNEEDTETASAPAFMGAPRRVSAKGRSSLWSRCVNAAKQSYQNVKKVSSAAVAYAKAYGRNLKESTARSADALYYAAGNAILAVNNSIVVDSILSVVECIPAVNVGVSILNIGRTVAGMMYGLSSNKEEYGSAFLTGTGLSLDSSCAVQAALDCLCILGSFASSGSKVKTFLKTAIKSLSPSTIKSVGKACTKIFSPETKLLLASVAEMAKKKPKEALVLLFKTIGKELLAVLNSIVKCLPQIPDWLDKILTVLNDYTNGNSKQSGNKHSTIATRPVATTRSGASSAIGGGNGSPIPSPVEIAEVVERMQKDNITSYPLPENNGEWKITYKKDENGNTVGEIGDIVITGNKNNVKMEYSIIDGDVKPTKISIDGIEVKYSDSNDYNIITSLIAEGYTAEQIMSWLSDFHSADSEKTTKGTRPGGVGTTEDDDMLRQGQTSWEIEHNYFECWPGFYVDGNFYYDWEQYNQEQRWGFVSI